MEWNKSCNLINRKIITNKFAEAAYRGEEIVE